jgi:hypothetical protein
LRPAEAHAADEPAIDPNGIRPLEGDEALGRRMHRKRMAERHHSRIQRAARAAQRLLGFQDEREFHQIEAADMNQRAGAFLLGHAHCVRKCIPHLAQAHAPERRGQIEPGLVRAQSRALRECHFSFQIRADGMQSL